MRGWQNYLEIVRTRTIGPTYLPWRADPTTLTLLGTTLTSVEQGDTVLSRASSRATGRLT